MARRTYEKPALTGLGLLRDRTQWSSDHQSGGDGGGEDQVYNHKWSTGS